MKFKFITIVPNFTISPLRNNLIATGFVCYIKFFVINFFKACRPNFFCCFITK